MGEVIVVVNLSLKPDRVDEALERMRRTAAASHGEEGCRLFAIHRDAEDPNRIVLVERWDSTEALENHHHEPHMLDLPQFIEESMTSPPQRQFLVSVPAGDAAKGSL